MKQKHGLLLKQYFIQNKNYHNSGFVTLEYFTGYREKQANLRNTVNPGFTGRGWSCYQVFVQNYLTQHRKISFSLVCEIKC